MNILMMTNTYLPHVGGVARSVATFTQELRRLGHRVIVVSPEYDKDTNDEEDTIRVPAIQHFNGSDFSAMIPIPGFLEVHLRDFQPDIVHSHHPFLMGSTAVRISTKYQAPLVYTQHTMFEQYTHYVPVNLPQMKPFVVSLCTGYANMADQVIAPSSSVAQILKDRKVEIPIDTVPTGIFIERFQRGESEVVRASAHIPQEAFVVGHVGRLAPEKNLDFLSEAVGLFLHEEPDTHFIVVGYGPSEEKMRDYFMERQLQDRVHFLGKQEDQNLVDAYHAMDVFAFSSKSETQGLVLMEAMAAGVPAVALNASGVRDVVQDQTNGYLLSDERVRTFAEALIKTYHLSDFAKRAFITEAKRTAETFSMHNCASKIVQVYRKTIRNCVDDAQKDESVWQKSIEQIKTEWELFSNLTSAVGDALHEKKN